MKKQAPTMNNSIQQFFSLCTPMSLIFYCRVLIKLFIAAQQQKERNFDPFTQALFLVRLPLNVY